VETIISSSFNFTKAAESKNAENLLIIQSPELALTERSCLVGSQRLDHCNYQHFMFLELHGLN